MQTGNETLTAGICYQKIQILLTPHFPISLAETVTSLCWLVWRSSISQPAVTVFFHELFLKWEAAVMLAYAATRQPVGYTWFCNNES